MTKTILIVEDDAVHGELLTRIITEETPHNAILATDGLAALRFLNHVKPDLFILDYLLPRIDGIELYDRLKMREDAQNVPILLLSAHLPYEEVQKRKIVCMDKPFELHTFLNTIEDLLS